MYPANKKVSAVIVNNMGGITTLIQNLLLYTVSDSLQQEIILLNINDNINAKARLEIGIITKNFSINKNNNWYATYASFSKLLSSETGILVSNDQYDLIMLQAFDIPKIVIQIVHDAYNFELSIKFQSCIDVFIAHSLYIYKLLQQAIPDRLSDIYHVNYGIPILTFGNKDANTLKNLKLLFIGRHTISKGVFDLFEINKMLLKNNILVDWRILGDGPDSTKLKTQWADTANVSFIYCNNQNEVLQEAFHSDLLIFPTKFEGFPVALLEAMSMGCVPIVTNLEGGIQEIVEDDFNGFKCPIDNNTVFVNYIILLHQNRDKLVQMQINAAASVRNNFNAAIQMPKYHSIFLNRLELEQIPRHHSVNKKIGSRLDQKWIPNIITTMLRGI